MLLLLFLVNLTPVQNWIARRAATYLSGKLHTRVAIGHVRIDFKNHLLLQGLLVEDQQYDTLLYAGEASVRISDWFFLKPDEIPVIHYLKLSKAYAHLHRPADTSRWNYAFVEEAFDTGPRDTTKKKNEFQLDLRLLALEDVRVHMDDAWAGQDIDLDAGNVTLDAKAVNLKNKTIDINSLTASNTGLLLRDYKGGRPQRAKRTGPAPIDSTPFNPGHWRIAADNMVLNNAWFRLEGNNRTPVAGWFDPAHMDIRGIHMAAHHLAIHNDTLTARINNMQGTDRCGFVLSHLEGDVAVSPRYSIVKNLLLQTPHSRLADYYAMYYNRFPDFEDYVEKVKMEARLKSSTVDARDIAFFAPELQRFGAMKVAATGQATGTVTALEGRHLDLSTGASRVRGDLTITGLPDIDNTIFNFRNGSLYTTGADILRFAPDVRSNPNINVSLLSAIGYTGSFVGSWHSFAANGVLATNLGVVKSNVQMRLAGAGYEHSQYAGTIASSGFALGPLLRQPALGTVAFSTQVSGEGFDANAARISIHATLPRLDLNGYSYRGLIADGVLSRKKFDGRLLVDDPNLAMAFDGTADFSGPLPAIDAKANLLSADLQKLGFLKDSVQASADFDLHVTGSNFDNFSGTARLYNINLIRYGHRLDIDSVYLRSSLLAGGGKELVLHSNFASATLTGDYQLSGLPYSAQYFLYRYLPNYIAPPSKAAPPQQLSFDVVTYETDSLLSVLMPGWQGFRDAHLTGRLDTRTQQLAVTATVPYGRIGPVTLRGISVNGDGNYNSITIDGAATELSIGDSVLSLSLDAHTRLGNDSLDFRVATTSPYAFGSATINGAAYARGDTLYATILPSEFFLNKNKWEIPAGGTAVFASQYLSVNSLKVQSGAQQLSISAAGNTIMAQVKDLELSLLGTIPGVSGYAPSGKANGVVAVDDVFGKPVISTSILARSVRLGADTLGDVQVNGNYATASGLLVLGNQTGIYRDGGWITATGNFDLDTGKIRQAGVIELYHAPLRLARPFLDGFVSSLNGLADGVITVKGNTAQPDVSGSVTLTDTRLKVDYTGVTYTLEPATIKVSNNAFTLPDIKIHDRFSNTGTLTGTISHRSFSDFYFNLRLASPSLEAVNLQSFENNVFYGNVMANASVTVAGPPEDIRMNIQAKPSAPGRIFLPIGGTAVGSSTYSYVSFKTDKPATVETLRRRQTKFSVNIDAVASPLLELSLILDPTTGDEIYAVGNGSIRLEVPADGDAKMYGAYNIDNGRYTFTFKQLFYKRTFTINSGSRISFSGPFATTDLAVNATYLTRASLYDLLTDREKTALPPGELADTRRIQDVNVLLNMTGHLANPGLDFRLELPEKRSVGTAAYNKLTQINANDRELFDQVASLLLIGYFIPPEGIESSTATSGAVNNLSEILSTTTSGQLTNIVNKLLGDPKLSVEVKYKNYNLSDGSSINPVNRNEVKLGIRRNFFGDRLILEVGSAYDWGRPTANNTNASNFNPIGDFRAQYLINTPGTLRLNAFSISSYDAVVDKNVNRRGIGLTWRKSFDNVGEFFGKRKG